MEENVHAKHRERMRKKLKTAPESLSDHEIAEMLLYSTIFGRNTNVEAHRLMDLSGNSLKRLLELTPKEIRSVEGLGNVAVSFFALLREFYLRVERERIEVTNKNHITKTNISQRLHQLFMGKTEEEMLMITTDAKCKLINIHTVASGCESAAAIPLKRIIRHAVEDKADYVFFAHNHPNEILAPSKADIETTRLICEALSMIEIPVIEHYIVTSTSVLGILSAK